MPKRYVFEVVIPEGGDEFWEEIDRSGMSGCDLVADSVMADLQSWNAEIRLVSFEDPKT